MPMIPEILLIGESLIDVVKRPGVPEERLPGGSPLNVAVGLGRLGLHPTLATWFGQDDDGRAIAEHCAASNVRVLCGSDRGERTSTSQAVIQADGHASYTFELDTRMPPVPRTEHPWLVHTGSLGATLAPGSTTVLDYINQVKGHATVTFDPNCRPSVMGDADAVRPLIERYVGASNLVKVSDEDLAWLYHDVVDETSLFERARRWVNIGPDIVVVTMGGEGAVAVTAETRLRVPADTSHGLADTVGAGDSFMAGLIHGMVRRGYVDPTKRAFFAASRADLHAVLAEASTIAGITVSRAGANPPWAWELDIPV